MVVEEFSHREVDPLWPISDLTLTSFVARCSLPSMRLTAPNQNGPQKWPWNNGLLSMDHIKSADLSVVARISSELPNTLSAVRILEWASFPGRCDHAALWDRYWDWCRLFIISLYMYGNTSLLTNLSFTIKVIAMKSFVFTRPLPQNGSSLQEEILSVCLSVCPFVRNHFFLLRIFNDLMV